MASGRKGRRLSDEERILWRGIARSITPLHDNRTFEPDSVAEDAPAPPAPAPNKPAASVAPPAKPKALPPLAPIDRRLKQRIARGAHAIDARIDLHGYTQAQAHAALLRFFAAAQERGAGLVLVITGKGRKGPGESEGPAGVLKRAVPLWLKLPEFRAYILGFEPAAIGHGGEGALYVRLRKKRA